MSPRAVLLVWAALVAGPLGAVPRAQEAIEYEVKAAFLYNFARFVEWPDAAFPAPDAPIVICVAGADPFGRALDDIVRDERVGRHPIAILRLAPSLPAEPCHLLFVSSSEQSRYGEVLAGVNRRRTVTVGDAPGFIDAGGLIRLFLEDGRVRFSINLAGLDAVEFHVSARLLKLARPVPEGS